MYAVVEKVENSASLYSKSIHGHHICLLVKLLVRVVFLSLLREVRRSLGRDIELSRQS